MNIYTRSKPIEPFKPIPEDPAELKEATQEVSFIVFSARCKTGVPRPGNDFIHVGDYQREQLWVRRWR